MNEFEEFDYGPHHEEQSTLAEILGKEAFKLTPEKKQKYQTTVEKFQDNLLKDGRDYLVRFRGDEDYEVIHEALWGLVADGQIPNDWDGLYYIDKDIRPLLDDGVVLDDNMIRLIGYSNWMMGKILAEKNVRIPDHLFVELFQITHGDESFEGNYYSKQNDIFKKTLTELGKGLRISTYHKLFMLGEVVRKDWDATTSHESKNFEKNLYQDGVLGETSTQEKLTVWEKAWHHTFAHLWPQKWTDYYHVEADLLHARDQKIRLNSDLQMALLLHEQSQMVDILTKNQPLNQEMLRILFNRRLNRQILEDAVVAQLSLGVPYIDIVNAYKDSKLNESHFFSRENMAGVDELVKTDAIRSMGQIIRGQRKREGNWFSRIRQRLSFRRRRHEDGEINFEERIQKMKDDDFDDALTLEELLEDSSFKQS